MPSHQSIRRYEFDRIRVGAIFVVFLYHSSRFFNLKDWIVKNPTTYPWVEILTVFAGSWMMPLFFVISGASLFYALDKSVSGAKFFKDKFFRLIIPVIVATVTHGALQVYLERLTHSQFSGSFFSFLHQYFTGLYLGIGASAGNFAFHGLHLWYLLFLFVDCLICYRLFVWFKGKGSKILQRITRLMAFPGMIYLWFSCRCWAWLPLRRGRF